jgi:AdoMet-dependent heme synthase
MDDMPLHDVRTLIEQCAEMGVEEFLVTGGEPLVREDLPEVIGLIRKAGLSWSLNTAMMPGTHLRSALAAYPPSFVAVSLDGPEQVHDSFRGRTGACREALEAIRYFRSFNGTSVCAGTTVTTRNFPYLNETFHTVANSTAHSWGIHLLVPEGRAADNKELFLSRHQLRKLISFVARKRRYFPVSMADEIGFCGDWEPLVRDAPLECGAGTLQCVVLPDGSVVPCTTLDRTTSAGNLQDRSLQDIWEHGFGDLRARKPDGACQTCNFQPACKSGCWLQRRAGQHCHKDTWQLPGLAKTAAGTILCLSMAAGAAPPLRGEERRPPTRPPVMSTEMPTIESEVTPGLEAHIIKYYSGQVPDAQRGYKTGTTHSPVEVLSLSTELAADPAGQFFLSWVTVGAPTTLADRAEAVTNALATKHPSLGLAALLWRCLLEPTMDGGSPDKRSAETRKLIRESLQTLGKTAIAWRQGILDQKLDPFLARDRVPLRYRFEMSKAYRPAPTWLSLSRDVQNERWGAKQAGRNKPLDELEGYIARHPYAEDMQLTITVSDDKDWKLLGPNASNDIDKTATIGVFDLVQTPTTGDNLNLQLTWLPGKDKYTVSVPPATELTYIDLLRYCYSQNKAAIGLVGSAGQYYGRSPGTINPLLMPYFRSVASTTRTTTPKAGRPDPSNGARWYLSDFWLF